MLLADRGYDADWIRLLATERGAWANIPPRCNRKEPTCFSPYLYRARNLIERFFNKIKQCRRVATRYDKLAANYLAFVKLASFRIWLRANESPHTKWGRKKASTDRRLSLACRPYATPSSISFFDHYLSNAHTAEDEAVKTVAWVNLPK